MSVPPVRTSANPRSSSIEPSVTTNGCTPSQVITRPCARPMNSDSPMADATAAPMPNPAYMVR